ncbi:MAG: hypothetical protein ACI9QL_003801 [Candidatus Omnitrophota bacterium]
MASTGQHDGVSTAGPSLDIRDAELEIHQAVMTDIGNQIGSPFAATQCSKKKVGRCSLNFFPAAGICQQRRPIRVTKLDAFENFVTGRVLYGYGGSRFEAIKPSFYSVHGPPIQVVSGVLSVP